MTDALHPRDSYDLLMSKMRALERMLATITEQLKDLDERISELSFDWDTPPQNSPFVDTD